MITKKEQALIDMMKLFFARSGRKPKFLHLDTEQSKILEGMREKSLDVHYPIQFMDGRAYLDGVELI